MDCVKTNKIVGIGACVMDTLLMVPSFPKEDTKLQALSSKTVGGGPTATGLVAAQKLGEQVAYIGVLSDDNGGSFLWKDFEKYGVNMDYVDVKSDYRSFSSNIWLASDTSSRTCVFDRGNLPPLQLDEEKKQAICDADILMIDGNEMDAAEEAARVANENGTKVLYDAGGLYEGVERLLRLTDILIPSEEFALRHTKSENIEEAASRLWETYHPEILVITCGKQGGVIYNGKSLDSYEAFSVKAIDTNGAGDVFHGAFAAAVVKGFSYKNCCLFASAVSAIKCTGIGARESVPDYETVMAFLKEKGYEL